MMLREECISDEMEVEGMVSHVLCKLSNALKIDTDIFSYFQDLGMKKDYTGKSEFYLQVDVEMKDEIDKMLSESNGKVLMKVKGALFIHIYQTKDGLFKNIDKFLFKVSSFEVARLVWE